MKKTIKELDIYISDGNYSSKYPRSEEFVEEGIPFIRGNNMVDGDITDDEMYHITPEKHSILLKGHVKAGDVLITTRGNIGQVAIVPDRHEDSNINAQIVLLRTNQETLYNRYLLWALQSREAKEQYLALQTGTALKQLPVGKLEKLYIEATDINKQHKIADVFDKTYKVIKLRRKELQLLDELIKARFVEMFGDININDKNWNCEPLGDLCTIVRGGSPRPIEQFLGGDVPWIKIGDATDGDNIYLSSTKEHIIQEGVRKSRLVKTGSLIFANCGVSLGFARIITFDGCIHDGWLAMEDIDERLDKVFLLQALNQMTEHFRAIAPAGTQPNLNTTIMKAYKQVIPPIELQRDFIRFAEQVNKSKVAIQAALDKSQLLFDSLMQKYFG